MGDKPDLIFEPVEDEIVTEEEIAAQAPPPPPTSEGPTREELLAEQERLRTQYEDAKRQGDSVAALKESMDGIRQALAGGIGPQPPQRQPGENEEDFRKRFNEDYINDPYQSQMEFWKRKIEPIFNTVASRNMYFSKELARQKYPETFGRYEADIDRMVQNMDRTDPEVYEKAHDFVMGRRWREMVPDKEALKAEILAELQGQKGQAPISPTPTQPTYSPGPPPSQAKTNRIVVTNAQKYAAGQIAARKFGADSAEQTSRVISAANRMVQEGKAASMDAALKSMR